MGSERNHKTCERNKKVNILKQKNQGQSSARNAGLKIAKGKYICFVDSDDMLMPNALEEMFYLSESRELDMLLFDIVLWYENDVLRQCNNDDYYVKSCQYEGVKNGRELFCEMWGNREYDDVPWSRFVKKTLLEDNGLIGEFQSGMKISEIAKAHSRTNGAIRSRLKKYAYI